MYSGIVQCVTNTSCEKAFGTAFALGIHFLTFLQLGI